MGSDKVPGRNDGTIPAQMRMIVNPIRFGPRSALVTTANVEQRRGLRPVPRKFFSPCPRLPTAGKEPVTNDLCQMLEPDLKQLSPAGDSGIGPAGRFPHRRYRKWLTPKLKLNSGTLVAL
jgi:hypothetical protein